MKIVIDAGIGTTLLVSTVQLFEETQLLRHFEFSRE